jgi:streptogramin lyase
MRRCPKPFAAAVIAATACSPGLAHDGVPTDAGPIGDGAPFTSGMSTLAGAADAGNVDGERNAARFDDPVNVVVGPDGTVYIADFNNGEIRASDTNGNVTTVINQKGFARPYAMAFAPDGTLYVETDNDKAANHDLMSGSIWTVDVHQHVAVCIANAIGRPRGLVVLPSGELALADQLHHVIETLDPTTGTVTTIAGTWDKPGYADAAGAAARFSTPYGMVLRGDGNLVVVDQANNRLRLVSLTGQVSTLAGAGTPGFVDGAMLTAEFHTPQAIAMASTGDLYVTDDANFRVRRVSASGITTVAGDGSGAYLDDANPLQAELYGLEGLAFNADDSILYISDGNRGDVLPFNRIRFLMMSSVPSG